MSLKTKLYLSLSAIGVVLLISSIISIMEYGRMSSYVSDLVADNIRSINIAQKLTDMSSEYHLAVLAEIGDEKSAKLPPFDEKAFLQSCDSLRASLSAAVISPLADSVEYSFSAYLLTSLEMQNVISSRFIDTREWYFNRLQPRFNRLSADIDAISAAVYDELARNSETLQGAFYRSIIPGIVVVGVGLLLVLLLLFFLQTFYVRPIYKMLSSLDGYRSFGRKYNYDFDGDDQLRQLNGSIRDLTTENQLLRRRISAMRGDAKQAEDSGQ